MASLFRENGAVRRKLSSSLAAVLAVTLLVGCDLEAKPTLQTHGGLRLVLQVETQLGSMQVTNAELQAAIDIVKDRAQDLGADNPSVDVRPDNRILVELPGVTDIEGTTMAMASGRLEVIDGGDYPPSIGSLIATDNGAPSPDQLQGDRPISDPYKMWEVIIRGDEIDGSTVKTETDEAGFPRVVFRLKGGGPRQPEGFAPAQVARNVAIVLDKEVISVPMIMAPMIRGEAVITGLTNDEANSLALVLRSSALPVVLRVVEAEQVPPAER